MKKLLALVLALVMTLGLATVSSSAAYSDAADIEYTEAVDVMTAVGVFQGKGDSFAPNDNLNRAEAAKLVAYLMLGNKTAESMIGSGTRFTDVPASHWAAGFIEYLASVGIVSGVGNNQFNPNGQVTGVQFAKMLLVALGYDAEIEKFVGDGWSINIQKVANQNDLFKGLDISANDALTRQQAAQMCLNDLKADMVEYADKGTTVNVGGATVTTGVKNAEEKVEKGSNNYNGAALNTSDRNYRQLAEELYGNDLKLDDAGRDDFGRPANKWTYKLEKVGTYAATGDLMGTYTAEVKRGPIYDLVGKTVYDNLVDGKSDLYFFEDGVGGLQNGTAATRLTDVEKFVQKNGDKAINAGDSSGNGSLTQVYVDDDDNVTITVVNTYIFQASSDYRKSTQDIVVSVPSDAAKQAVTSVDNNRLKLEDFPEIESFKKDDYLLVTAYKDGNKWTADSVAKAELKTATVDKVVVEDSITLDGTVTKYGKKATSATKGTEYSVGQETTVVLDKYGYIMYVDDAVVANNYVFISELYQNGGTTTNVQANAYFTDGTNKAISVKKVAGISNKTTLVGDATSNAAVGVVKTKNSGNVSDYAGWYTYTVNSSNEYTLNALSGSYHEENEVMMTTGKMTDSDAVKFIVGDTKPATGKMAAGTAKAAKANDKTIVVVTYADKTDVDVYTGVKNIPEIKLTANDGKGAIFSVLDSSNYAKYVFVTLEGGTSVFGTESENLLYVVKYDHKNREKDNNTYYTYKALDENAKEITIEASENLGGDDIYAAYYKTSKDSDGRYTRIEHVPNQSGKYLSKTKLSSSTAANKIVADGNTLDIGGDSFTLADNYKLVVVSKVDTLNRLIKDNKGYEADIMTAEGLEGLLQDYNYTYDVQAKTNDNYTGKGGKLVEAYVTITNATANNAAAGTYTLTWNLADNAYKANITGVTVIVNDVAKSTATSGSLTVDKGAVVKFTVTTSAGYSAKVSENNFAMNSNKTVTITGQAGITAPIIVKGDAKQEQGTVSNVNIINNNLSAAVNYTVPEYVADGKVYLSGKVTINGVTSSIDTVFAGTAANSEIEIAPSATAGGSGSFYLTTVGAAKAYTNTVPAGSSVSFSDLALRFENITVKYYLVDTDHEIASSKMVDSISKLNTTDGTTTGGTATANVKAAISSTYYQGGAGETLASFSGVKAHANGSAAEVNATSSTKTWVQATTGQQLFTNDYIYATGTDYVKIVFKTQTEAVTPLTVKMADNVAASGSATPITTGENTKAMSNFGLPQASYPNDYNKHLVFEASPNSGAVTKNGIVTIKTKFSADIADAYAYDVKVGYTVNSGDTLYKTFTFTKGSAGTAQNLVINGDNLTGDVLITSIETTVKTHLLRVTKATFDATIHSVTLTFSEDVLAADMTTTNFLIGTFNGANAGAAVTGVAQGASAKEVVIYFDKGPATGDTVKVLKGVKSAENATNDIASAYTGLNTGIEIKLGAADGSDFNATLGTNWSTSVQDYT